MVKLLKRSLHWFADRKPRMPTNVLPAMTQPPSRYVLGEWLNERGLIGCGVEVGTYNGWYASDLLHQWRGEKLYLIDAWRYLAYWDDPMNAQKEEQGHRILNTFESVYKFGRRVVMVRELSEDAVRLFTDGSMDFIYIDADHSYAGVLADILRWAPKVKKGGILAGHDYLDGQTGNGAVYGVKAAVDEWARRIGLKISVIEERPGHESSWLLQL